MSAPLSGVGQQQLPIAQPFQPGGSDQTREVRQRDQQPRETEVQARQAPSAQSQEANNTDVATQEQFTLSNTGNGEQEIRERGSLVDIVV